MRILKISHLASICNIWKNKTNKALIANEATELRSEVASAADL